MKNKIYAALRAAAVAVFLLSAGGCRQTYELKLPLSTSTNEILVTKEAGTAYFMVYSTHDWSVEFDRPITWATMSPTRGSDNGQVLITYDMNSDLSRGVDIIIRSGGRERTVYFAQATGMSDPVYSFVSRTLGILKDAIEVSVDVTTNLTDDDIALAECSVVYGDDGDEWIDNIVVGRDKVAFSVSANTTGFDRMAELKVEISGAYEGEGISTSLWITQSAEEAYVRFGSDSYDVKPEGEEIALPFRSNFAQSALYDYTVTCTVVGENDSEVTWLSDVTVDGSVLRAVAAPNKYEPRKAYLTLHFVDENGVTHSGNTLMLSQLKTTAGIVDGDNGDGEEPKDPETDF